MALSRQRGKLYDPLRGIWIAATPEEIVRQRLLRAMIHQLGYPKHFLAVEKQLSELPNLIGSDPAPMRRLDILCYSDFCGELTPLLLIECKEVSPDESAHRQVLGYNHFVRAPFVAVASLNEVTLIFPEHLPYLPYYCDLQEAACN
jgi:hypothetical protein